VIQVGIPGGTEQYIHRVGRTGRAGTQGRGDLVLLPWEIGFVTWQLTEVPLKPLTLNELTSQVKALANTFDADPKAFFKSVPGATSAVKYDHRGRAVTTGPRIFATPTLATIEDINRNISESLDRIDEEAIKETFSSLLGYYIAKSPELRTQKGVIVQGCKDWAVQACGLPTPPYVSDAFLQRLGFTDGRTKHFGRDYQGSWAKRATSSPWGGRGQQKPQNHSKTTKPSWGEIEAEAEEYRSHRYGTAPYGDRDEPRVSSYGTGRSGGGFGQRETGRSGYGGGRFGRREYGRSGGTQ